MTQQKSIFQGAMVAALVAFVAVWVVIVATALADGTILQPSDTARPLDEFVRGANEYPNEALLFFMGDSAFILSYLMVFVGLYAVTSEQARAFALMGLGMGVLTAALDATENASFITYALNSKAGFPLTNPALPLLYIIGNLKWMAAFATLYAFGLGFPRRTTFERIILATFLLFPLVGVLGVYAPDLIAVRGLFFPLGMPLLAWYFRGRAAIAT